MRKLADLLDALPPPFTLTGDPSVIIRAPVVESDAEVEAGGVFVARAGLTTDGHEFIPNAISRGAAAIVGEKAISELGSFSVPYVQVKSGLEATGWLAAAYHGLPSRKLTIIGVTGTDGKTTTSTLLHSIMQQATNGKCGLISTISADLGDTQVDTGFHVTTPGAPQIQALLARMVDNGLTACVLEMTSHGLAQGRLNGVDVDIAVLTNLSHEHLDYHGTFEAYREAKGRLFAMLTQTYTKPHQHKISVINADDPNADFFAAYPADRVRTYGVNTSADVRALDILYHPGYTQFVLHIDGKDMGVFHLPLAGAFNISNALAAITAARAYGAQKEAIEIGLLKVTGVSGRLERIDEGQTFTALVDFAHTPNALKNALLASRSMCGPDGRVICVFGCAGLRDREKRRLMPQNAMRYADISVFTAEDPRTESLDDILSTMTAAAAEAGGVEGRNFHVVPDRGEALLRACLLARQGDVVIACGKGHEQSMAFGTTEYAWDDREALRAALRGEPLRTLPTAPREDGSSGNRT